MRCFPRQPIALEHVTFPVDRVDLFLCQLALLVFLDRHVVLLPALAETLLFRIAPYHDTLTNIERGIGNDPISLDWKPKAQPLYQSRKRRSPLHYITIIMSYSQTIRLFQVTDLERAEGLAPTMHFCASLEGWCLAVRLCPLMMSGLFCIACVQPSTLTGSSQRKSNPRILNGIQVPCLSAMAACCYRNSRGSDRIRTCGTFWARRLSKTIV